MIRKHILAPASLLIALVFLVGMPVATAGEAKYFEDNQWCYYVKDGKVSVYSPFVTSMADLVIPASIKGYPVTEVWGINYSFAKLKSVTMPDTVTRVTGFFSCPALTSVQMPDGVVEIGNGSFDGCVSLPGITFPKALARIGDGAFTGCVSLAAVSFPPALKVIGESAFGRCVSLASVNIPAGVTAIGDGAFYGCEKLASITVDPGNQAYGIRDFSLVRTAGSVLAMYPIGRPDSAYAVPAGIKTIGAYAFSDSKLVSVTLPAGLEGISAGAFNSCGSLAGMDIPAGVRELGVCAFMNCVSLGEIKLPGTVKSIGACAFSGCSALHDMAIPDSVAFIGDEAFSDCDNLVLWFKSEGGYAFEYARSHGLSYRIDPFR